MGKRKNTTRKKRSYTSLVTNRRDSNCGPIQDHNIQVNPLPDPGKFVIVNERHIYERSKIITGEKTQHVCSVYLPNSAYTDAYGFPCIYKVLRYEKGKGEKEALDPKNVVILGRTVREGKADEHTFETRIRTILVATGSIFLEEVPKDFHFKTKDFVHCSCEDLIIATTSTYDNRKHKGKTDEKNVTD